MLERRVNRMPVRAILNTVILDLPIHGQTIVIQSTDGIEPETGVRFPGNSIGRYREAEGIQTCYKWLVDKYLLTCIGPVTILVKVHPGIQESGN